ncbi:13884_t:CDS:2, partial [Entrophospora sp. SA101]
RLEILFDKLSSLKFTMGGFINVSVVSPKTWSDVKYISLYDRDKNNSHEDTQRLARTHSFEITQKKKGLYFDVDGQTFDLDDIIENTGQQE